MNEFPIENGIPIPAKPSGTTQSLGSKYPFDQLEVGQSFFVPERTPSSIGEPGA